ncbi:MAG: fibronectin type III domain-containing protein [Pyrinomonadaceae bacterium]
MNKTTPAFILIVLLILGGGCGKRKPPMPPIERVPQRVEISGFQRGNRINLIWTMPARNAPDGSVLNISRADVYRLAEPVNSTVSLTEDEFASRSTLIASMPITASDFARKQLKFTDELEFAGQPVRLRYAVRFVNDSGQKAAFSNFLLIEPTSKIASAPLDVSAEVTQDAVLLNWKAPQTNVDGSKPANVLGYNIYRSASEAEAAGLLNKTPVGETKFADEFFNFKTDYFYFVRTVSLGSNGEPVESSESNVVKVSPKDTFAPSAPTAITIAAAPSSLSIFFAVNPEKDIAGYRIYRSENPNLAKQNWQLLTKELLTTNTFQDTKIESGKTYYYYLTAVDTAGNISQPSEVVSETAP